MSVVWFHFFRRRVEKCVHRKNKGMAALRFLSATVSISSRSNKNTQIRTVREKMDDENVSCAYDGEEDTQLSLLNLPVEIFLRICSFLDASTLVYGLRLVCKQFYRILKDDPLMWKARINCIWPGASHSLLYPARPDKLFWMSSCVAIEKQTALWKQQDSMEKLINTDLFDCPITAMLLMHDGTTCVAGDSNGNVFFWMLPSSEELPFDDDDDDDIGNDDNEEIADLTAIDNTIYSCSYGCDYIKSWMLTNTSLVRQPAYRIDLKPFEELLVMSSCPERALFATGSNNDIIYVFDSRASNRYKPIMQYRPQAAIPTCLLGLAMNTEYILSAHANNTMSVWDQRTGRIMKSITISDEGFPTCMSMQRDWVLVGDSRAKCHMLNPKNDFELVKSYSTEHRGRITGVHLTHGCLITSSADDTVIISSPTDPPKSFATLHSGFKDIYKMDYLNDTLAITGTGSIVVWRPKSKKYQ